MLTKFNDKEKDVDILKVTAENYIVPDGEKHLFHVTIEIKKFDPNTGERISRPRLQKFNARMFAFLKEKFEKQGYTITVLYDPTEYLKDAKNAKGNRQKAARQAEIDAAVAKALAKKDKSTTKSDK